MAVDEERTSETVHQERNLLLDGAVVWPVCLIEPFAELDRRDRAAPEVAVLLGPRRNDAEPAPGPSSDTDPAHAIDHRWVHVVLGTVAVDRSPRRACDDRAAAAFDRSPNETIHQRILKACQRRLTRRCTFDEPVGIVSP